MKFLCTCGADVFDVGDYRGHMVAADALERLLEMVDAAIEGHGPRTAQARAMQVRQAAVKAFRPAWQCHACSRLFVDGDDKQLMEWVAAGDAAKTRLFGT